MASKIVHVVPSFGFGGMEKIICAVIKGTPDYCHEMLSLDNDIEAMAWLDHAPVDHIEFHRPAGRVRFFRTVYNALKKANPDLLMTYNWGATDAIWLGRLSGITRIIHNEHGYNADEGAGTYLRRDIVRGRLYRMASRDIVVSSQLETMMKTRYGLGPEKVTRIPNGIDVSYYCPDAAARQCMRSRLGFKDGDFVVGFSGRLDAIKNLSLLVAVFARLCEDNPNARLLVVGDGPEGERLQALCAEKRLARRVVFAGQRQEVLPYLRAMDAFLLTSGSEQMPLTVLEAMSVGLPTIATRVGEIPSIIDEGKNGFLHSIDDGPDSFARSLIAVSDPCRRKAMGRLARNRVSVQFEQSAMVQRYQRIIQATLGIQHS